MARDEDQKELDEIRRAAFELRGRDPNEAVRVLRRAVRKGGAWEALAHGALAEILLDDFDDVDGALHHFEKLQKLAPGLPAAELGMARTLARGARLDEAQEAYARALVGMEKALTAALDNQDATEEPLEGLEENVLGALEAAVEERELLLQTPTGRPASTPSPALLDRAEKARVLDLEDDDVDDWARYAMLRGTLLALDGAPDDGLQVVARVAELAPLPETTTHRVRSLVLEAGEKWDEAARALEASVEGDLTRLDADDTLRLAVLMTGGEREEQARRLLEGLKRAHPDDKQLIADVDARLEQLPKPSLINLGLGRGRAS